jgi:hypothetical protein
MLALVGNSSSNLQEKHLQKAPTLPSVNGPLTERTDLLQFVQAPGAANAFDWATTRSFVSPHGDLSWFATEWVTKPIALFRTLRGPVIEELHFFANVYASTKHAPANPLASMIIASGQLV